MTRGAPAPLSPAAPPGRLVFHLIPHTHWDREWYLPRGGFHVRLVALIDDLLDRLRGDGAFRTFLLDGQTILVEDYLRVQAHRAAGVRLAVASGRLQVGPWYVLADEQIASGESLIRNLLLGTADADRLGHRLDVLYSPDAFGHPAAWPALAREFGMRAGVVWRGVDASTAAAGDRFRWRAPDGREVFVWHLPPAGYEIGAALPPDPEALAAAWARVRGVLAGRARGAHVPVFLGADHHVAHPRVGTLRASLAALEPRDDVRVSRLDECLAAAAAEAGELPVVTGELRAPGPAWALQGTHGTRTPAKRRHAVLALWLERVAEPLVALARRAGGHDHRPALEEAWRTLLANEFHDTLCGTVSDPVARAARARGDHVAALARELTRVSLLALARHDPDAAREDPRPAQPALVLWNPAARPRSGVAIADVTWFRRDVPVGPPSGRTPRAGPGARAFGLRGADGADVPVQVLDRRIALERIDARRHYPDLDEVDVVRVAFAAPPVAGLGVTVLEAGPPRRPPMADGAAVVARSLVNRYVEVALEETGALTLVDRATRSRWTGLLRVESGGDVGDAYTVQAPERDRLARSAGPLRVRRIAAGPLVAALEARWRLRCGRGAGTRRRGHVDLRLVVTLHADSPVVRCLLELDNRARDHRLRARLPLGLAGVPAVAGSAFTPIERPSVVAARSGHGPEAPVSTAPAHRFVAVVPPRSDGRGLAVLAPGFFEYEWTPGGDLLVTLLRAIGELSRDDLAARPGHAAWPTPVPDAQCLGRDHVELALVVVSAGAPARGDALPRHWEDAFLPVRGVWLRDARALRPAIPDATLEGSGLVLSAVKPAQAGPGTVLRCYNATGRAAAGAWRFGVAVRAAYRVRADERESVPLVLEDRGRAVRFTAGPHEIVTVVVE